MLRKLQRKTLVPAQIAGYALTLLVGVSIVLVAVQAYVDLKPLLTQQTDVFKAHTVTVSKNITVFKTANKENIYFDEKELSELRKQEFVKEVAQFNSASFNTSAAISFSGQRMSTELFFESVPDDYIDVRSDDWKWDSTSDFLPIVIPEDYLNLYNFGFAESQSLPVVSEAMLSQVTFNIFVTGNGKRRVYNSRIVGLSGKINSILVPEDFLEWANNEFGTGGKSRSSRLLVEFTDASDERIPQFFEANGLNINKSELESSRLSFFFRMAMLFVLVIALIIVVLSAVFIVMSVNLIVQKNRSLFVNLHNIGYTPGQIARFYHVTISAVTVADLIIATLVAVWVRGVYLAKVEGMFNIERELNVVWIAVVALALVLLVSYNLLIARIVRNEVGK